MDHLSKSELLQYINTLIAENQSLKHQLVQNDNKFPEINGSGLSLDEFKRYGRQMIVPEFGSLPSQKKLKTAKVLIIGAGGLGCPALLYLAGSGIGQIGIVDDDIVDTSNLHRQVLHSTETVGMLKCDSAKLYINKLNPHVNVITYAVRLNNANAFTIFQEYDVILDCSDSPVTRYLVNDVAVILNKTVVSGSGIRTDGQWTILNFNNQGPCYRCFHPQPPVPDSVTSCQDGGVIGPAIGIIGVNMALETIKILVGYYDDEFVPFMRALYGWQFNQYRTFKMRNRQINCAVCGNNPSITRNHIESNKFDYHLFCGRPVPFSVDPKYRVTVDEYAEIVLSQKPHILIDVRPKEQFQITSLPNSINIPWDSKFSQLQLIDEYLPPGSSTDTDCFVVCRYGNDSQIAAQTIINKFGFTNVKDIIGGISKWSDVIDDQIPKY